MYCLQTRPYTIQPRSVTGLGSEGVKNIIISQHLLRLLLILINIMVEILFFNFDQYYGGNAVLLILISTMVEIPFLFSP